MDGMEDLEGSDDTFEGSHAQRKFRRRVCGDLIQVLH
jgi:hypothetical protein